MREFNVNITTPSLSGTYTFIACSYYKDIDRKIYIELSYSLSSSLINWTTIPVTNADYDDISPYFDFFYNTDTFNPAIIPDMYVYISKRYTTNNQMYLYQCNIFKSPVSVIQIVPDPPVYTNNNSYIVISGNSYTGEFLKYFINITKCTSTVINTNAYDGDLIYAITYYTNKWVAEYQSDNNYKSCTQFIGVAPRRESLPNINYTLTKTLRFNLLSYIYGNNTPYVLNTITGYYFDYTKIILWDVNFLNAMVLAHSVSTTSPPIFEGVLIFNRYTSVDFAQPISVTFANNNCMKFMTNASFIARNVPLGVYNYSFNYIFWIKQNANIYELRVSIINIIIADPNYQMTVNPQPNTVDQSKYLIATCSNINPCAITYDNNDLGNLGNTYIIVSYVDIDGYLSYYKLSNIIQGNGVVNDITAVQKDLFKINSQNNSPMELNIHWQASEITTN
jgi:hypothetical protein